MRRLQHRGQGHGLQPGRFVDREMIDRGVGRDIDVLQPAVEAGAGLHIGVFALRQVEHASHVPRRRVGTGTVERHHQCDRNACGIQLLRHRHDGVGAKRVTHQYVWALVTGAVFLRDLVDDRVGERVVIDGGFNAAAGDLRGKLVHAERENVEEAAHQIDVRMGRLRVGEGCLARGEPGRALRAGRHQEQSGGGQGSTQGRGTPRTSPVRGARAGWATQIAVPASTWSAPDITQLHATLTQTLALTMAKQGKKFLVWRNRAGGGRSAAKWTGRLNNKFKAGLLNWAFR